MNGPNIQLVHRMSKANKQQTAAYSNPEIITIAVHAIGGDTKCVDTEDVAMEATKLAPGRFMWRKYPDQVSFELVRRELSRAKTEEHGAFVFGSVKAGWMLTEAGLAFARGAGVRLHASNLSRERLSDAQRKRLGHERARLVSSDAYKKVAGDRADSVTKKEAMSFFRIDEYVSSASRRRKIMRIRSMFRDDAELGVAVVLLADRLKGENDHD